MRKSIPSESELLIHCSAGKGRSGALACNLALREVEGLTQVNLVETFDAIINQIRRERSYGIPQKAEQYKAVYLEVLGYLQAPAQSLIELKTIPHAS